VLKVVAIISAIVVSGIIVKVYNPYRVKIQLQVKCDYDNKIKRFKYNKTKTITKRGNTKFILPDNIKRCQVWPKVL
jgi:hypothetical protein